MPTLTRVFIKTGMIYFLMAMVVGVALAAPSLFSMPSTLAALRPVYFHLFMVGWVLQLIIGIAFWMFPKLSKHEPRGSEALGWLVYICLNIGLIFRAFGEILLALRPGSETGWTLALAAVLQLVAGWGFIVNTWLRVKER